jgi:hypothetical protein
VRDNLCAWFSKKAMFEHRRQAVVPRSVFYARLARSAALACAIILTSLVVGIAGYHFLERMPWIDAFVNAAMILSGMGPVGQLQTFSGKVFAGCYALFSGLTFISAIGVVFAPIFHRFLHKFHLEEDSKTRTNKGN